jgi:PadR family transcriptional regulator PadR
MAQPRKPRRSRSPKARAAAHETVVEATRLADAREAATLGRPRGRHADPLTGELRKHDVLPLLVLHFICREESYGNQLMERISGMTEGALSINPNTMYPLLRELEGSGLVEGRWEHPERRSRRLYRVTPAGRKEYRRLVKEVRPALESVARSVEEIVREVYG